MEQREFDVSAIASLNLKPTRAFNHVKAGSPHYGIKIDKFSQRRTKATSKS